MNKRKIASGRTSLLFILPIIALSAPAMGQGTEALPTIVVPGATVVDTGEYGPQDTTVVGQGQRPDTATIVNQEELKYKSATVVYDAIEQQPGLNVVNRLGTTGSGLSRLTIRGNGGVGPSGVQVYIDGRPDSTVSFAHPIPSAMGLAEVKSIEVIHGPSPVLHGSGKAGVVNIITADPEPGLHAFIQQSIGSFDTSENFTRFSYGGKNGYARLGYSYRSTNGSNPDSDAMIQNINFKGKLELNEIFDVTFAAMKNDDKFQVFREFFVPGPFTDPRTNTLSLTQTVYDFTINADFGNVVSSLKFFQDELDPRSQVLDAPEKRADVVEKGFRFKTTWAASQQTNIIAGIDYLKATAKNSPVLPPFGGPGLSIPRDRVSEKLDEKAIYVFAKQNLTRSVSVSGGVRHTIHSEYGGVQSGELGILFKPEIASVNNPLYGTTFRARATRGYQSPTLQQLYGVFRGGRNGPANTNLGPEKVHQYEVGFNKAFRRGSFDLVFYTQKGYDLIGLPARPTRNPNFPPPPPFIPPPDIQNDVDYFNRGVEARLRYSLTENLDTLVGISIAEFDQDTNRFLRVPEKTVDVGFIYRHSFVRANDFSFSLFGRYARDTYDVPLTPSFPPAIPVAARLKLDDYFVANLKMNYDVNDNFRMFFGIDNITDQDYELVTGIPALPLSVYAGIRIKM